MRYLYLVSGILIFVMSFFLIFYLHFDGQRAPAVVIGLVELCISVYQLYRGLTWVPQESE